MVPEYEEIQCSSDDLDTLQHVGLPRDAIANLIHEAAVFIGNYDPNTTFAGSHESLSTKERAILREGGAIGLDASDDSKNPRMLRLLFWLQGKLDLLTLQYDSLDCQQFANSIGISIHQVDQLSDTRDLFFFYGLDGKCRYPLWQIHEHKTIPHLQEVLRALSSGADPVSVSQVMTTPTLDLEVPHSEACLSPREWLIAGNRAETVLRLVADL